MGMFLFLVLFVIGMSPYTGEEFENFKAVYRRNYIRIEPENSYGYSWSLEMFEEFDDFYNRSRR